MKTSVFTILCLSVALLALTACSDKREPETVPVNAATSPAPAPEPVQQQQQQQASPRLLKSSRANFIAKLPCEDCPGIELSIGLQRDELSSNSFVLRYQRMGRESTPAVLSGNWILEARQVDRRPAAVITLNPGNSARRALLRVNNDNSLTLIEGSLNGVSADTRPVLRYNGGKLDLQALYEQKLAQTDQR